MTATTVKIHGIVVVVVVGIGIVALVASEMDDMMDDRLDFTQ